jgi:type II secretory pathway pseudopilin PulG
MPTDEQQATVMIRYIGPSLHRIYDLTIQRFNDSTKRSQSSLPAAGAFAFTITELLIVIAIIIVLAGLILSTVGYLLKKAARSRAETEIAAMSTALESYKADNGIYPTDSTKTEQVDPAVSPTPAAASLYLYEQLSGDTNDDRAAEGKSYFTFKPGMLLPAPPSTNAVTAMRDPFGNPYGYSTARAAGQAYGYNPTFDLWSTGGDIIGDQSKWIKNW